MDDLSEPFDQPRRRGRQSAAAMAVLPVDIKAKPLPPPERLSEDEKAVWRETVASVRPGWFESCENLLEIYCRAICVERQLAELLRQANPADEGFANLVRLHKSEMLACAHLEGRLRLTTRSIKPRDSVRGTVRTPRPWEFPFPEDASDDDEPSPSEPS
jgi:hypothetical protein